MKRIWTAALATAAIVMLALLPLAGDPVQFRQQGESRNGGLALATPGQQQAITTGKLTQQETEDLRMLMRHLMLRLSDQRLGMFEPVDQLANGIRPLAITFNLAFDTLRRTLPGYSEPQSLEPQALHHGWRPPIS